MPSLLFRQTYERIGQRDHVLIAAASEVRRGLADLPGQPWPALKPISWREARRLAAGLVEEYHYFHEALERASVKNRFRRGGDQLEMLNQGFPAVRITEAAENYTRQHQTDTDAKRNSRSRSARKPLPKSRPSSP